MASMFIKRKKRDSLRIRLLKVNAKRAKIEMESASNSIQDTMTNEEEAEDNNMCQVEALGLSLPLNSENAQPSTDSGSSNPSSPTLSSVEQQDQLEQEQEPNSQVQNQTQSNPKPITNTSVEASESEQECLSTPSPFLFEPLQPPISPISRDTPHSPEPDQRSNSPDSIKPRYSAEPDERSNSPDPIKPCYSAEPDERSNSPNPIKPCYSPDPHQSCSSPDPTESDYDSPPSSPERELNSEQEHEELFPRRHKELEQNAENLPLQRMQELQALGNILFFVGRSMSDISSLYDLLLKHGVDFQRDADTRLIFRRRVHSVDLNLNSATNLMHGIDFPHCFEKKERLCTLDVK